MKFNTWVSKVLTVLILSMVCLSSVRNVQANTIKISGDMPEFGDVDEDFQISLDGRYVVYIADFETDGAGMLYSTPTNGHSAPVRLSGLLPAGTSVAQFEITPDSNHVIYIAAQDSAGIRELYWVPLEGSDIVKLNRALAEGEDISSFQISSDSSNIVYTVVRYERTISGGYRQIYDLYSLQVSSESSVELNHVLLGSNVIGWDYQITSTDTHVLYRMAINGVTRLFSIPIAGGNAVNLSDQLPDDISVFSFEVSENGETVIFRTGQYISSPPHTYDLYSIPTEGGTPNKINEGNYAQWGFKISPDSNYVVFQERDENQGSELYSHSIIGDETTKLNGALVSGGTVLDFSISPDSSVVVYQADQQTNNVVELYSVPIAGGSEIKLNNTLVTGQDIWDHRFIPETTNVAFVSRLNLVESINYEFRSSCILGPSECTVDISAMEIFYWSSQDGETTKLADFTEAFASSPTLDISDSRVRETGSNFQIGQNGNQVVYSSYFFRNLDDGVRIPEEEVYKLFSTGMDGSTVELNPTFSDNKSIWGFNSTHNSDLVIYRADQETDNVFELFAVQNSTKIYLSLIMN